MIFEQDKTLDSEVMLHDRGMYFDCRIKVLWDSLMNMQTTDLFHDYLSTDANNLICTGILSSF